MPSEGRSDPEAGCKRPRSRHPLRCLIRFADSSGNASRRHFVAFLGIVVQATTFVARPVVIPVLQQRALRRIYSAVPNSDLYTDTEEIGQVLALIHAAGWPIWPIILASVVAVGIIGERLWALRLSVVAPRNLLPQVVLEYRKSGVTADMLTRLQKHSPLGQIFAAGLKNDKSTREIMKESIEEAGRAVAHELERYLTTLG